MHDHYLKAIKVHNISQNFNNQVRSTFSVQSLFKDFFTFILKHIINPYFTHIIFYQGSLLFISYYTKIKLMLIHNYLFLKHCNLRIFFLTFNFHLKKYFWTFVNCLTTKNLLVKIISFSNMCIFNLNLSYLTKQLLVELCAVILKEMKKKYGE